MHSVHLQAANNAVRSLFFRCRIAAELFLFKPGGVMSRWEFRQATLADLDRCHEIEAAAYPADEAATREKIAIRIRDYPEGFRCLVADGALIGFINCGCAWEVAMSAEEFKQLIGHDPLAPNVVIMSVVIHPDYQGQGWSSVMMKEFVSLMTAMGKKTIHLMCKQGYLGMYEKAGYRFTRLSASTHGGEEWYEMMMDL
jgi:ribosomal protein S18 acetylase RimI-like enzyme